ncbi:MAG: hypothetical protein MJ180_02955 [Candidatus Gastranaerophilales bacterium]|nr:hypothetical protein [Candidatus Gastranaerophilales bacterium]
MVEKVSNVLLLKETNTLAKAENKQNAKTEENLSEILSGQTKTEKQKKEDKSFFENHKTLTMFGGLWLASTFAAIVFLIGRNPATAAKFLKGTSKMPKGSVFAKGQKIADEIFADAKLKPTIDKAMKLFKKPEYPTMMSEKIVKLENYLQKNPAENEEILKTVQSLKVKLAKHLDKLRKNAIAGGERNYKASEEFTESVKAELTKISEHLRKQKNYWNLPDCDLFYDDFYPSFCQYGFNLNEYIGRCPEELLNSRLLYHGTTKAKGIYKNGFSPFGSRQITATKANGRELGAGAYFTPDIEVSRMFTGGYGSIIPVQLSKDAKIALVTEDMHSSITNVAAELLAEKYGLHNIKSALKESEISIARECITRRLFLEAGYDGAYMPKAMRSGLFTGLFNPDVNKIFGKNQSQVVIFNPEHTQILSRGIIQRIKDIKDNYSALIKQVKNGLQGKGGSLFC